MFKRALFFVLVIFITACGGGDGGSSSSSNGFTASGSPDGFWNGIYTTDSDYQFLSSALITSNGKVGIDLGNGVVFIGTVETIGNEITILGHESIASSALITIIANATSKQTLNAVVTRGSYAISTDDSFSFTYDDIYERSSSIDKLSGTWSASFYYFGSTAQDWTITVESDGSFTGTASVFDVTGSFSLIDENKNEYQVNLTMYNPIPSYTLNGDYVGFATLLDDEAVDDTLLIFLDSEKEYGIIDTLELQRS
jgi:hypothetical protein